MRAYFLTFSGSPREQNAATETARLDAHYRAQLFRGYSREITRPDAFRVAPGAKRYLTNTPLCIGDICCHQSHLAICREIVSLNLPWAHVFEDDVFLQPQAGQRLAALDDHLGKLPSFGFISLHTDEVNWDKSKTLADDGVLARLDRKAMLMHGYTISLAMARQMLANETQTTNWDIMGREQAQIAGLPCYRAQHAIAGLSSLAQTSERTKILAPLTLLTAWRSCCPDDRILQWFATHAPPATKIHWAVRRDSPAHERLLLASKGLDIHWYLHDRDDATDTSAKHLAVTEIYNQLLASVSTPLLVILEDDNLPTADTLPGLLAKSNAFPSAGAIMSAYASRQKPDCACAGDQYGYLPLRLTGVVQANWVGGGCTVYQTSRVKACLPLVTQFTPQLLGWDRDLCAKLRAQGYHIFVDFDHPNTHLCVPPSC